MHFRSHVHEHGGGSPRRLSQVEIYVTFSHQVFPLISGMKLGDETREDSASGWIGFTVSYS
jgi:hypothetical protein